MGAPNLLTRVDVERGNPATDTELGAGHARHHRVPDHQRGAGNGFGDARVSHLGFPDQAAVRLVQGADAAVDDRGDNLVAVQRDATVVDAAAQHARRPVLVGLRVRPPHRDRLATTHVELGHHAPTGGQVQETVFSDRRAFQAREWEHHRVRSAALDAAHGVGERDLQIADGVLVDFAQAREAVSLIVAVMVDPVLRLGLTVDQTVMSNVAGERGTGEQRRTNCSNGKWA